MARRVRIRRVVDGDSLEVKYAGLFSFLRRPFPVRLYGIDAPELAQPYGRESRRHLESLVRRGGIRMDVMSTDRYGRTVGLLYRRRRRAQSVNVEMVRSGMAWWYRRYGGRDLGFADAEAEAKRRRRGVWKRGDRIQRPWDYRADLRRTRQRRRRIRRVLTWMLIGAFAIVAAGLALAIAAQL